MKPKTMTEEAILDAAYICMKAVFEGGAGRSHVALDLGGRGEGWCMEIILRELTDEEKAE